VAFYSLDRKELGRTSEEAAAQFIRNKGLKILVQNYRCRYGEIDIVARDGECLVFVEVRSSRGSHFADPKESVGARKRRTLSKVALNYLKEKGLLESRSRFDVVTVIGLGAEARLEWMKNAFEAAY
jgi:putative endonuclease